MAETAPRITSAVLVESQGKFLLGKRNKKNAHGLWVIPGGGVDYGETIQEAAIREIKEETNLDIEIVKFLTHKEVIYLPEDYHRVIFFHLGKPKHLNFKASDDLSEIGFFSMDEIKKMNLVSSAEWLFKELGYWK